MALPASTPPDPSPATPFFPPLFRQRHALVLSALRSYGGVESAMDAGCGDGELLDLLTNDGSVGRLLGIDPSAAAIGASAARLRPSKDDAPRDRSLRVDLVRAPMDEVQCSGYDAATLVEVIEHLDPAPLNRVGETVLGRWRPRIAVVTTPNAEFNHLLGLAPGETRHDDHRFEWTRAEFASFARSIAGEFGYSFALTGVGSLPGRDPGVGPATQAAVFWLPRPAPPRSPPELRRPPPSAAHEFPVLPPLRGRDRDPRRWLLARMAAFSALEAPCGCPLGNDCLPLVLADLWGSSKVRRSCGTASGLVRALSDMGIAHEVARRAEQHPWAGHGLGEGEEACGEVRVHCSRRWLAKMASGRAAWS